MEITTIIHGLIIGLAALAVAAYWYLSRESNQAHLNLLCKRDRLGRMANLNGYVSLWNKLEWHKITIGAAYIVLLFAWGALQLYLGSEKTVLNWVFVGMFSVPAAIFVVVAEHYQLEDLFHSCGFGKRAGAQNF
jgi:isocitrate dehydrogenase kinase/phosphatase